MGRAHCRVLTLPSTWRLFGLCLKIENRTFLRAHDSVSLILSTFSGMPLDNEVSGCPVVAVNSM